MKNSIEAFMAGYIRGYILQSLWLKLRDLSDKDYGFRPVKPGEYCPFQDERKNRR